MSARFPRLIGLAAAASLIATPLIASPAHAAPDGLGSATITIKDDLGAAVKGMVQLIPVDDTLSAYMMTPTVADTLQSSYTATDIPVGDYALVVMGGWPLVTCVGITPCGFGGLSLVPTVTEPTVTKVITVTDEGAAATSTVVTETPKLTGTPRVGETLEVVSAVDFGEELGDLIGEFVAPKIVWQRNGTKIAGAKGTDYTLKPRDAGTKVSATISYPGLLKLLTSAMPGGADLAPAPITKTTATVTKNASSTSLKVSGGTAYVRVSGNADELTGWVQVSVKGQRPIWARVQEGFVPVSLPTLKAGKYKVTAAYQGNGELNGSSDSATVKVKKAKKRKL